MTGMGAEPRRYLVVGPSWVGDMVMAQSLYISLRRRYPDCTIDVVAPGWSLPILARMPEVRQGIELPVAHGEFAFFQRCRAGRALRSRYSHAIVLPRSWKSALVPFFAAVPVRTGYRGEMRYGLLNDIRDLDKSRLTQTVQRYVALGQDTNDVPAIPYPKLTVDTENQQYLMQSLGLDQDRPVIGMMPGAEYGPAKQWPIAYYARLASRLAVSGYQVWVFGSDKEKAAGESIAAASDEVRNLCGRTRLVDVVDLLAATQQVVSNDSGLMHVAAALGVKVNVIYGSSTPAYTPPLADEDRRTIIYLGLECSPCFKRECPLGHTDCLRKIDVNRVYSTILG